MGRFDEIRKFNEFLKSLDDRVKYKVVTAGNHDLTFDDPRDESLEGILERYFKGYLRGQSWDH